ncbi:MAG TPA: outer membrane protein assembly factor BamD [Tepidisphaeraceae bacterium]|nr:outer membrane protein assembly factor BamD [Tepidisphaeraceae bacterium]
MAKAHWTIAICSLFLCASASFATPQQTWVLENGRWIQTNIPATTQPVADPILDSADNLLSRHQPDPAHGLLIRWVKTHKGDPRMDRALFLLADAYYQRGDRLTAFYQLDQLLDQFPDSPLFDRALEKQYEIADAFLRGYKRKFLGMRIIGADDEAIEMLFRIQQRAPGSQIAEKSLLRTADYYFATRQYDLAEDAYSSFVRQYPRSTVVPQVRLQEAFCSLAQFRGLRYDATPLVDARAQLEDIINAYPELARQENLNTVIARIDTSFARKILITGHYYERVHNPRGAVYNYRFLIQSFPNSPEAQSAERRLKHMPQWALATPPPAEMNLFTTKPSTDTTQEGQ